MNRKYITIILCAISILFASCINGLEKEGVYDSTRCHGVVLDNRSYQPIRGLRVMVTDGWNVGNMVYTAADGSFEIPVTLNQLAGGYFIRFEADSLYQQSVYNLASVQLGSKEYDMGTIYLIGPNVPIVTTGSIVDITATSALCYGSIENEGNSSIRERGFVYSTMQFPTIDNDKVTDPIGQFEFDCTLPLQPHTVYYIRAYAINSIGVGYGDQKTITTLDGLPVVITSDVTNITTTTATCGGNVLSDAGFDILARGICWSTASEPTINNAHTSNGIGLGSFVSQMTNLEPNSTYHVRAYAQNSSGIAYGPVITFSTLSGLPTVTTTTASNITSTSAVAGGNVSSDGGYPVLRRGVCFGTSPQPTITGLHTTDGAGMGSFVSQLTNLTPGSTYYYRAYATNGVGTIYGEQQVFVAW